MEPTEVIKQFHSLFEKFELLKAFTTIETTGMSHIQIPFFEIAQFNASLSDELLDNPEETMKAMQIAAESLTDKRPIYFLITGLPKSNEVMIKDLRSVHLNKMWSITGTVKRKTDVRPKITSARFECPSCGNTITVLQLDQKFKEPGACGCGRKGRFNKLSTELVDAYGIVIEELTEYVKTGSELKKLSVLIKGILANSEFEQKIFPGVKVKITGILKPLYLTAKDGGKKSELDLFFEANSIEITESDYEDIILTEADKEKFMAMVRTPEQGQEDILTKLATIMFSDIEGFPEVKKGIVLQMAGGEQMVLPSGFKARGDIHILLIGDPGSAKSTFCKLAYANSPKARYVSGKGASGAGLTAAVVRDEMMGGWALEAGAIPLAHHGLCVADEFDKVAEEETDAIHEALEEQQVSISKANIQATLKAETSFLAAANPKFGRFDKYSSLYPQINLPIPLLTRFDLIFPFFDEPDPEHDREVAKKILSRYRLKRTPEMSRLEIRKYFAFTKQFHPLMDSKVEKEIEDFYVTIKNGTGGKDGNQGKMPISPRYIEVIRRLSEAHARLNLRNKVQLKDVQIAIEIVMFYLKQLAINPDTGKLDVDMLEVGMSSTGRSKRIKFLDAIDALSQEFKEFDHEIILDKGKELGLNTNEIEEMLTKAVKHGELYEPRPGKYQKLI